MASYFLARRPGMMPSQSWATIVHFAFIAGRGRGDVDVEARSLPSLSMKLKGG